LQDGHEERPPASDPSTSPDSRRWWCSRERLHRSASGAASPARTPSVRAVARRLAALEGRAGTARSSSRPTRSSPIPSGGARRRAGCLLPRALDGRAATSAARPIAERTSPGRRRGRCATHRLSRRPGPADARASTSSRARDRRSTAARPGAGHGAAPVSSWVQAPRPSSHADLVYHLPVMVTPRGCVLIAADRAREPSRVPGAPARDRGAAGRSTTPQGPRR